MSTPGTWDDDGHFTPGVALTHTRTHDPLVGPPYCLECTEAWQNWVRWPCEGASE